MKRKAEEGLEYISFLENTYEVDIVDEDFQGNVANILRFSKESLFGYLLHYYERNRINQLEYLCSQIPQWEFMLHPARIKLLYILLDLDCVRQYCTNVVQCDFATEPHLIIISMVIAQIDLALHEQKRYWLEALMHLQLDMEEMKTLLSFLYQHQEVKRIVVSIKETQEASPAILAPLMYLIDAEPGDADAVSLAPQITIKQFDRAMQDCLIDLILADPKIELLLHHDNFFVHAILEKNSFLFKKLLDHDSARQTLAFDAEPIELFIREKSTLPFLEMLLTHEGVGEIELPWEDIGIYLFKMSHLSVDVWAFVASLSAYPHYRQKLINHDFLHKALFCGSKSLVLQLAQVGEILSYWLNQENFLYWASHHNVGYVVALRVDAGISKNDWFHALGIALEQNHAAIVRILVKKPQWTKKNKWNEVLVLALKLNCSLEIIEILLNDCGFVLAKTKVQAYLKEDLSFLTKQYLVLYGTKKYPELTKILIQTLIGDNAKITKEDAEQLLDCLTNKRKDFNPYLYASFYQALIRLALVREEDMMPDFFHARQPEYIDIHKLFFEEIRLAFEKNSLSKEKMNKYLTLFQCFIKPRNYFYNQQCAQDKTTWMDFALFSRHALFIQDLKAYSFSTEDCKTIILKLLSHADSEAIDFMQRHLLTAKPFKEAFVQHMPTFLASLENRNEAERTPLFCCLLDVYSMLKVPDHIQFDKFIVYPREDISLGLHPRHHYLLQHHSLFDWDSLNPLAGSEEQTYFYLCFLKGFLGYTQNLAQKTRLSTDLEKLVARLLDLSMKETYPDAMRLTDNIQVLRKLPVSSSMLVQALKRLRTSEEKPLLATSWVTLLSYFKPHFFKKLDRYGIHALFLYAVVQQDAGALKRLIDKTRAYTNITLAGPCFGNLFSLPWELSEQEYCSSFNLLCNEVDKNIDCLELTEDTFTLITEKDTLILKNDKVFLARKNVQFYSVGREASPLLTQGVFQFKGHFSNENPEALAYTENVVKVLNLCDLLSFLDLGDFAGRLAWTYALLRNQLTLDILIASAPDIAYKIKPMSVALKRNQLEVQPRDFLLLRHMQYCYLILMNLTEADSVFLLIRDAVFHISQLLLEKVLESTSKDTLATLRQMRT